jgi:hypothetical protein
VGVDATMFWQLVALSRTYQPSGRMLTLGRQWYLYRPGERRTWYGRRAGNRFQNALDRFGVALQAEDLVQPDRYGERMFEALGFGKVESVDRSCYEGATQVWDMNDPVPVDWHGSYDCVFDGGTVEHIFNVPMVFENVHAMLGVGGRYISATPFNGWPGHGLYQFGPEIVWSYWHRIKRCKVHACTILSLDGGYARHVPDPARTGRRSAWGVGRFDPRKVPPGRTYLWYVVEKTDEAPLGGWPQQSDYEAEWDAHSRTAPVAA